MDTSTQVLDIIKNIYTIMPHYLDEKQLRLLSGCIADGYGRGGIKLVCGYSDLNYRTVKSGVNQITGKEDIVQGERVRKEGAGRPNAKEKYPTLLEKVKDLLDNNTYGDPERILTWTNLSLRSIAAELKKRYQIDVNKNVIADVLEELGYSRQVNQKYEQVGEEHPDRESQFNFINEKTKSFIEQFLPVISVDTKKKELIGNFKNNGSEYRPIKNPRIVNDHDFSGKDAVKISPYGIYVLNDNTALVNLGTDYDTSEFAVESIRRWWNAIGKVNFPNTDQLYINCDGGGSNGWRVRLWKYELALFAQESGLKIHVSHFPPGTSKWNKVEHRLFSYITKNWEGKPLIDIKTTIKLISSTKTKQGLTVNCVLDDNKYEKGIKLSDDEYNKIDIERDSVNPSWNYTIKGILSKG